MPLSPPRPCPKHPKVLLSKGDTCPHCPKFNWKKDSVRGNRHQRGYGKAWETTRAIILKRDKYLCQPCKRNGHIVAAKQVDHKIPKAQGGTDNHENLQSICISCHANKTAKESKQV